MLNKMQNKGGLIVAYATQIRHEHTMDIVGVAYATQIRHGNTMDIVGARILHIKGEVLDMIRHNKYPISK